MFGKIFKAIGNLFSSLFGGNSTKKENPSPPTQTTRPQPESRPRPDSSNSGLSEEALAQDGSEIQPDTVVLVAHEREEVVIGPNAPDPEMEAAEADPLPAPEPEVIAPATEANEAEEETPPGRFMWCLDNGHGSKTAGKRSPKLDDEGNQFFEYEFNRDIVKRIIKALDENGKVAYFNVVPEVDTDNFLEGRVQRANALESELPKLFVSIHANAAPARNASSWAADNIRGIETWYFHNSKRGQKLAAVFQKHLLAETGFKNRHLKSRPDKQFFVLRKTKMTAVLTENGFYNNRLEVRELMKDSVRQKIADAHVKAILEVEQNGL